MFETVEEVPEEIAKDYVHLFVKEGFGVCGVHRLLYHWTLHVGITEDGYNDRYCYATRELAEQAIAEWEGEPEPNYWHRHPVSGRRRDVQAGTEWVAH